MSKIGTMSAGASGMKYNVNMNGNQGGGNSKQGLPPTATNFFMVPGGSNNQYNRAVGQNRDVVFCMNQLGGVGRGRTQFGSGSRDGVGKTGGCGTDETNENIQKLIDYFKSTHSTYDLVLAGNNTSLEQELSNCCSGYTPATGDFIHISEIIYLIQLPTAIRRLIEAVNVVSNNLSHSFNRQDNGCGTWLGLQRLALFTNQGTAASILQTCNFGTTTWYGLSVYTAPEPTVYTTPIYIDYSGDLDDIQIYNGSSPKAAAFMLQFIIGQLGGSAVDYVQFDSGSNNYRIIETGLLCIGLSQFSSSGYAITLTSGNNITVDWSGTAAVDGYANTAALCDKFYIDFSDGAGDSLKIGILEQYRYGTLSGTPTEMVFTFYSQQIFPYNSLSIFQPSTNVSNPVNNYTWLDYTNSEFCLVQTDSTDTTYSPASTELVKYTYFSGYIANNTTGNYVGTVRMPDNIHLPSTPATDTMTITMDTGSKRPAIVLAANCTGDLSSPAYTDVSCNIGCTAKNESFSNGDITGCGGVGAISDAPIYYPEGWSLWDDDVGEQRGILACDVEWTHSGGPPYREWNYFAFKPANPWIPVFKDWYETMTSADVVNYDTCLAFTFNNDPSLNMIAFGWGFPDSLG